MTDRYRFWTHGVAVVPQNTPHLTGHQNGLFMMPLSWGTLVRQDHGTSNWFHIPLTSPSTLDDWPAHPTAAHLNYKIGDHAEITKIHVVPTAPPDSGRSHSKTINTPTEYSLRSRDELLYLSLNFNHETGRPTALPNHDPMVMSIHVEFDGDGSDDERTVLFRGAGIFFLEEA